MQVQPVGGPYLYNLPGTGLTTNYPRPDYTKVAWNCCHWTNVACARVLVIFNSIQVVICYISLIFEIVIAQNSYDYWNSHHEKPILEDELRGTSDWDFYDCAKTVTKNPIFKARLSTKITFLAAYSNGSVLLFVGVFMKSLGPRKRGLCLLIYLLTINCLPLAYLVPVIIDLTICTAKSVFYTLFLYHHWWYIMVLTTTWLGIHIEIALRKWVMRDALPISSELQQQMQQPQYEDWEDSFDNQTSNYEYY